MTTKAEQKQHTNESILASAARLLRDKGITGARVADVMKGAGLTVGGFYAHFASKEALIEAALRRTSREMRERLFAKLDAKPEGDRAEIVLKRYVSAAHRDNQDTGCPLPATVGEIATTAPEHAEILGTQLEAFAAELETYLPPADSIDARRDARRGEFAGSAGEEGAGRPPVQRRQLALATLALMYGGLSLARAVRGTELSDEIIRAVRACGRLFVRG